MCRPSLGAVEVEGAHTDLLMCLSALVAVQTTTHLILIMPLRSRMYRFRQRCFMIPPVRCRMFQPTMVRSRGSPGRVATSRNRFRMFYPSGGKYEKNQRLEISCFRDILSVDGLFVGMHFHRKSRFDLEQRNRNGSWST